MDKLLGAISICRKAGKLVMGTDVVKQAVQSKQAKLVLLTSDLSERSDKQIREACTQARVPARRLPLRMEELSHIVGKEYGILAVCDSGLAKMIVGKLPNDIAED